MEETMCKQFCWTPCTLLLINMRAPGVQVPGCSARGPLHLHEDQADPAADLRRQGGLQAGPALQAAARQED